MQVFRKSFLALGLSAIAASVALAQTGVVVREPAGGFSYVAPKGWTIRTFPGMKYHVAGTNAVDGFAPNINVVDEHYAGNLTAYAKANLRSAPRLFPTFQPVSQSSFTTASDLPGVRVVANVQATGQRIKVREIFYFFAGKGDRRYTVTFGSPASQNGKFDAVGDAAMRTFTLL